MPPSLCQHTTPIQIKEGNAAIFLHRFESIVLFSVTNIWGLMNNSIISS